ncbi:hypothetical protein L0244_26810, partial [bacterium]|nr:hypothetical protein [bacterium]
MLGLIAVGCTSLFETAAMFAGEHWSLHEQETIALAKSINGALDTLPGGYYAAITKVLENYFPWLTLAIITSKIVIPRVDESIRQRRERTFANQTNTFEQDSSVSGNS